MNIRKLIILAMISGSLGITAQRAIALEDLSTEELAQYCQRHLEQQETTDAKFCVHYLQGFIDGAIATDTQVMLNVEKEYEKAETFTERAMRTRMPARAAPPDKRAAMYAEFCLGDTIELKAIVGKVSAELVSQNLKQNTLARESVYDALKKHYPCSIAK